MIIIFRRLAIIGFVTLLSLSESTTFVQAGNAQNMRAPATRQVQNASAASLPDVPVFSHRPGTESIHESGTSQLAPASPPQQNKFANLALDPPGPFVLGDHPTIMAHLTSETGRPLKNQPIIIYVDGKRKGSGQTDSNGLAAITLKFRFAAGTYHIKALYAGVPVLNLPASSAEADMIIRPYKAVIRTIPPTAGIKFRIDHHTYTSDEKGFVNFRVERSGSYLLEILPVDDDLLPPNMKIKFSRWNDNIFTATRQVYFPRHRPLEAGFVFEYLVDQLLYDTTGVLVDPARVSSMTLKGLGSSYTFDKAGPIWLPANRLSRRIGEQLESHNIVYYFKEIQIDGANVINKSQQHFNIRPAAVWPIDVLVYSIEFSARDAMFQFPIGTGIELTYPDGHTEKFLFDSPDSKIKISSLARGSYSATVITGAGSAPPTPIHVSRDQSIGLLVLSFLDMTIMFGVPLILALTLFFIGRPRVFQLLRNPARWRKLIYQRTRRGSLASQVFKAIHGLLFSTHPSRD